MARITGTDAANIQQADVSSIAYSVYDLDDETTATVTGTLTVSSVVYDTLQTDARWDTDTTGYNFRWDVPASVFADGDKIYRIEIAFTPASGEVYHVVYEGTSVSILRS